MILFTCNKVAQWQSGAFVPSHRFDSCLYCKALIWAFLLPKFCGDSVFPNHHFQLSTPHFSGELDFVPN